MIYKAVQATKGKESSLRIVAKAISDGRATDQDVVQYISRTNALRSHLQRALVECDGFAPPGANEDSAVELKQCGALLTQLKAVINSLQKSSGLEKSECARAFQSLTTRLRVCKMAHYRPPVDLSPEGMNDLFHQVQQRYRQSYDAILASIKVCI